jgi:ABC-2 type transport system permease protein
MLTFAKRNIREILRDPLNLAFGLGFPLVLLLLLSAIQTNVPVPLFEIAHLAPGISVFGLSFLTLFSATVISKDRGSALLQRLYTTPMTAVDFILGYTLPMLPLALIQTMVSYLTALCLGLQPGIEIFYAVGLILPVSVLYIAMGLLCGSVFNEKQVGGVCGALLTNLSAWLSGIWFDLELVGGVFQKIANLLPFVHAVELERAALKADWAGVSRHIWWVLGYACVLLILAVSLFLRQMKRQ